jgi:hypothetical protein
MAAVTLSTSLFEEPWWLDAVAPGSWQEVRASDGSEASARIAVQVLRRRGLVVVRNPPLTPVTGPAFILTAQKHEGRMAQMRTLVEGIISTLPKGHLVRLGFAPGFDDHLPFRWAGFQVGLSCTYRIDDLHDLEQVWAGLSESCRRAVRKAKKSLIVRSDLPISTAIDCIEQTFVRQERNLPFSRRTLESAIEAAQLRQSATCLVAEDAAGRPHASAIIVHDDRCAYYLAGGADPVLRSSGAQSLLLWSAIERASQIAKAFDFEGSSNPQIERFFRSFGPRRVPVLAVARRVALLTLLDACGVLPKALGGI